MFLLIIGLDYLVNVKNDKILIMGVIYNGKLILYNWNDMILIRFNLANDFIPSTDKRDQYSCNVGDPFGAIQYTINTKA